MSRQITHSEPHNDGARARNFFRIEKMGAEEGSHAAWRILHQRALSRDAVSRVRNFLRIEKGWTA